MSGVVCSIDVNANGERTEQQRISLVKVTSDLLVRD